MGVLIGFAVICGIVGGMIGTGKKMGGGLGFFLGLMFGPLGLLVVGFSSGPSTLDKLETRPVAAGWQPDPLGRFDSRYWDGARWTQHVGRVEQDGTRRQLEDPV